MQEDNRSSTDEHGINPSALARSLQTALRNLGVPIKLSTAQEAVAQIAGLTNWRTLAALRKQGRLDRVVKPTRPVRTLQGLPPKRLSEAPALVQQAFAHVVGLHPGVVQVQYAHDGTWLYATADGHTPPFDATLIDVGLLEDASNEVETAPVIYMQDAHLGKAVLIPPQTLTAYVDVRGTPSDPEDEGLPGVYAAEVRLSQTLDLAALSNAHAHAIAAAVLDEFHDCQGIEVVDDFTLRVLLSNGVEVCEDPAQEGSEEAAELDVRVGTPEQVALEDLRPTARRALQGMVTADEALCLAEATWGAQRWERAQDDAQTTGETPQALLLAGVFPEPCEDVTALVRSLKRLRPVPYAALCDRALQDADFAAQVFEAYDQLTRAYRV